MKNEELQKAVLDAIKWEPLLHEAVIDVTAVDGIVTLSGTVNNFSEKSDALLAAQSVAGVKAVVEHMEIQLNNTLKPTDADIAAEVVNALKLNWQIPADSIKVEVEDGWITLTGSVKWNFQKLIVSNIAKNLIGVKGLVNSISIKAETDEEIEQKSIEDALCRSSSIDERHIVVHVSGHKVTLSGNVTSWHEKMEAERITWNAPGVSDIDNKLNVEHDYLFIE